jgi:predicted CoA-binding protein
LTKITKKNTIIITIKTIIAIITTIAIITIITTKNHKKTYNTTKQLKHHKTILFYINPRLKSRS